MKERPIIFSAPMVRAILAGTKTQTRRVFNDKAKWHFIEGHGDLSVCPYGQPGDRLFVRESARCISRGSNGLSGEQQKPVVCVEYAAGGTECFDSFGDWFPATGLKKGTSNPRWASSTQVPRWASRITLEITGVRVERLQDISETDAQAEGTTPIPDPCDHVRLACADIGCSGPQPHRLGFRELWRDINGPDSWEANPWVWVLEFKRVD